MVKKRRLKKKIKRMLIYLVAAIVLIAIGIKAYSVYKYHQTYEYKLLQIGYSKDQTDVLTGNLDDKHLDELVESEKREYLVDIINAKYYLSKNYDKYVAYHDENADTSIDDIIAIINVGADKEWYTDAKNTDLDKGYALLANKFNLLPEDYKPAEVKTFSSTYAYGTVSAESECFQAFIKMADEARKEDVRLVLSSGYRTRERQEKIYNDALNSGGEEYADGYAARPGASEHETGLALDILSTGKWIYTSTFSESPAYQWLINHAHEYGFILRYPEGKEYLTGYKPESWHFRYLGVELATKVKNEGITYDEYYAYYLDK